MHQLWCSSNQTESGVRAMACILAGKSKTAVRGANLSSAALSLRLSSMMQCSRRITFIYLQVLVQRADTCTFPQLLRTHRASSLHSVSKEQALH
jgi:hypothetical protein